MKLKCATTVPNGILWSFDDVQAELDRFNDDSDEADDVTYALRHLMHSLIAEFAHESVEEMYENAMADPDIKEFREETVALLQAFNSVDVDVAKTIAAIEKFKAACKGEAAVNNLITKLDLFAEAILATEKEVALKLAQVESVNLLPPVRFISDRYCLPVVKELQKRTWDLTQAERRFLNNQIQRCIYTAIVTAFPNRDHYYLSEGELLDHPGIRKMNSEISLLLHTLNNPNISVDANHPAIIRFRNAYEGKPIAAEVLNALTYLIDARAQDKSLFKFSNIETLLYNLACPNVDNPKECEFYKAVRVAMDQAVREAFPELQINKYNEEDVRKNTQVRKMYWATYHLLQEFAQKKIKNEADLKKAINAFNKEIQQTTFGSKVLKAFAMLITTALAAFAVFTYGLATPFVGGAAVVTASCSGYALFGRSKALAPTQVKMLDLVKDIKTPVAVF